MKNNAYLVLIFFLINILNVNAQELSGGKKRIHVNTLPVLEISDIILADNDKNQVVERNEKGVIKLKVTNTGKSEAIGATLKSNSDGKGLFVKSEVVVGNLKVGETKEVDVRIIGRTDLTNETVLVSFEAKSKNKARYKPAETKVILNPKPLKISWITPADINVQVSKSEFTIETCVQSTLAITNVTVYVNDKIQNKDRAFNPVADANCNLRIKRDIALKSGENRVKVVVRNNDNTATSVIRVINYKEEIIEKRLALIIGNSDYQGNAKLGNPINDAVAMAGVLKQVHFEVMLCENADQKTMKMKMDEFGEKLKNFDIGLFYFAGHGLQVNGRNYLVPVDASLNAEQDVEYDCVDAGRILGKMESAGTQTNIIVLDACRNNPFERSWSGRSSDKGKGLAFMNAPSGSLIAYATSPGNTASDGKGEHGVYTEALLKYILVPGLQIEDVFKKVRETVENDTDKKQTPWESTSLKGEFYFKR